MLPRRGCGLAVCRWEYCIISPDFGEGEEHQADTWLHNLNDLGAVGWEVIGSVATYYKAPGGESLPISMILAKRQKS